VGTAALGCPVERSSTVFVAIATLSDLDSLTRSQLSAQKYIAARGRKKMALA
jgi:hypothetical protein